MNSKSQEAMFSSSLSTTANFVMPVESAKAKMSTRSWQSSDRLIEWQFAFMMMVWGLWLMFPSWITFTAPQYALLASIANEAVWGAFSFSIGFIRAIALYINGSYHRTPIVRLICSILGLTWWFVLIYLFILAAPNNPAAGFSWYPVFAVFEAICCWRSASDAFQSRAFRRPNFSTRKKD